MFIIKFPHRVKLDQTYYPPNKPIEVEDATKHVEAGAVVIQEVAAAPKSKPAARRTKKPSAEE